MDLDQALTAGIELALNRYLSLDSEALARFSSLEGKVIAIDIKGIHKTVSLFPSSDGFMVLANFDGDADATISGTPVALAKMSVAKDPKDLLFSGEIKITGDTVIANQFNRLLSQLDIDWEEILSQNIGDIAAHKIGTISHQISQWFKRSTHSVFLDAGEYIQEEVHLSPSNAELIEFIRQVDEIREATDRLKVRIDLLKK